VPEARWAPESVPRPVRLGYGARRMEFIDNWFPLVVMVREGSFDAAEIDQMSTAFERYFRRGEPYTVLSVARLGAHSPDARARLRIAEWASLPRVRQFSKLLCAGTATVVSFPWERRALTALFWLWTPASPHQSVATVHEGLEYCLTRLAEWGVGLPRERETFRIDVQRMLRGLSISGLPPRRDPESFDWVSRPPVRTDSLWRSATGVPTLSPARAQPRRPLPRGSRLP
jgi:hypothetical protein